MSELLLNLTSGLIGAVLGVIGAVCIERWKERQRRMGAGRAVLAELLTNAARALRFKTTGILHSFSDTTWHSQLPLVAQLLPWPDLQKLVLAYDSALRLFENSRALSQEKLFDQKYRNNFLGLAKEFRQAIEVLRHKTLSSKEKLVFESDLAKFDSEVASIEGKS